MNNTHLIPADIRKKISTLGFHPTNFVPLYKGWSVVAIRNEKHYNIKLDKELKVVSIHELRYKWNATGAQILGVTRIPVEQKAPIRVI